MTARAAHGHTALSFRSLAIYGLPAIALAIPTIPVYVQLPGFYATEVGVGLSAVGAAMLAARLTDVVTDPVIGLVCDGYPTPFGRRKPWMLAGAIVAGIAMFQLFLPPAGAGAFYLLVWATLLYFGWSLVAIPYSAWGAELSPDYHVRARVTAVREGAGLLGIIAAGSLMAIGPRIGWTLSQSQVAVVAAAVAIGAPTLALLLWTLPEPRPSGPVPLQRVPLRELVRGLHRNRLFQRLIAAWLLNGLANGLAAALFPLYLVHLLQADDATQGLLIFAYFASAVAAIPGWLVLSRRIGKHRAWCCAMILASIAFLFIPAISPGQWPLFLIVCIVTGVALGADLSLPPALQADIVDYDSWKFGRPRAGLLFALWSMATKLALALAVGISFPILDLFGFDARSDHNAPLALSALLVTYAIAPILLKLATVALVWGHPLTFSRHLAIRTRLARRA